MTLTRPEAANGISLRTLRELTDACEAIANAEAAGLVVVDGEGPDFCAGWEADASEVLQKTMDHLDPFGCLASLPMPVLAILHGNVASAGLELALACDLRLASDDARLSCPDVAGGNVPLAGATARLPRIAGRTVATAMLLLGDELDAEAAYRCGLVSRVLPAKEFKAQVEAIAERITANGPIGLRYAKEAVHNGIELPLDQALRYELDLSIILQTTRDRAEGVDAFLQKRPPKFEGR
jgi:enoyl-CoA hydratase/carnithine racemase